MIKASMIRLLVTDCDGVLTDGCAWYDSSGEAMKRFSMRDGMGVERLRKIASIETAIITGENSMAVKRRAEKLGITLLFQGIDDKGACLQLLARQLGLKLVEIAYIGDDVNDLPAIKLAGLTAAPADAFEGVVPFVDYITLRTGGNGAFREFAELIIESKNQKKNE